MNATHNSPSKSHYLHCFRSYRVFVLTFQSGLGWVKSLGGRETWCLSLSCAALNLAPSSLMSRENEDSMNDWMRKTNIFAFSGYVSVQDSQCGHLLLNDPLFLPILHNTTIAFLLGHRFTSMLRAKSPWQFPLQMSNLCVKQEDWCLLAKWGIAKKWDKPELTLSLFWIPTSFFQQGI